MLLTAMVIVAFLTLPGYGAESSLAVSEFEARKQQLLTMTAEECYEFLAASGMDMPKTHDKEFWGTQGLYYVQYTIDDPNYMRMISNPEVLYFSLGVSSAVNHYLGLPAIQDEYLEEKIDVEKALRDFLFSKEDEGAVDIPSECALQNVNEQILL